MKDISLMSVKGFFLELNEIRGLIFNSKTRLINSKPSHQSILINQIDSIKIIQFELFSFSSFFLVKIRKDRWKSYPTLCDCPLGCLRGYLVVKNERSRRVFSSLVPTEAILIFFLS